MFIGVLLGAILVSVLLNSYNESLENENRIELVRNHSDAVLKAKTSLNTYVTIVASIKAFVRNCEELPSAIVLQNYVKDVIGETDFNDSLVVSFLDNDHYFQYVFTPTVLDPKGIVGTRLSNIRPQKNLNRLDSLNKSETNIRLVEPLNVVEGWAALPFSFRVKNKEDSLLGYIAVVISSNYLLRYINQCTTNTDFESSVFLFDSIPLVENAFLDGTPVYTDDYDPKIIRPILNENTIDSKINFFGYQYRIFTERISDVQKNTLFKAVSYFWYISIFLICIVLFFQFKNRLKLKQELENSNKIISLKNNELEEKLENIRVLGKEVHHRVKNNMQIMSSLLNLQSFSLIDESAKAALLDSKNRIHSMALVHKKLYETNNFKKVNVYQYTNDLIVHICHSLGDREIVFKNNIQKNIYLDSDTMVSMGLIFNELVTNSVKYAFNNFNGVAEMEIVSEGNPDEEINITYRDNGNWVTEDNNTSGGFGLELIQILASDIEAKCLIDRNKSEFELRL